jgi:hypothetical protein
VAAMIVGGLILAIVVWLTRSDQPRGLPMDTTVGTGPYRVNGTCRNRTCVLYERGAPSVSSEKVARLSENQKLTIVCQVKGGIVKTPAGSSNIWDRLYNRRSGPYVSDYFTDTPGAGNFTNGIARCPSAK